METPAARPSRPLAVRVLIGLHCFLGASAIIPGTMFVAAPDGRLLKMPLSNLEHSPFRDFIVPGLVLGFFLGVYPLGVAYGLWKRPAWRWPVVFNPFKRMHWSWAGSLAAGVIVLIWILVEMAMLQAFHFLHTFYLAYGLALILVTFLPSARSDLKA